MREVRIVSGADVAAMYQKAWEAERRARRSEALALLQGCEDWPAPYNEQGLILRAEALTLRDPILGLEDLAAHSDAFASNEGRFDYLIASARAYTNARNFEGAQEMLDAAAALLGNGDQRASKIAYHKTRVLWATRQYNPQDENFALALRDGDPAIRFAALTQRAWMYGGLENSSSQLEDFVAAFKIFREHGFHCDVTAVARTLYAMLQLAFELGDEKAIAAGEEAYEAIEWTSEIQVQRFLAVRALAWHAYLQGEPGRAQWLFKTSKDIAPTPAWQVMAHVDRAYVARMNLNEAWAVEELYQAHALARAVNWSATKGEERVALMTLAALFATVDMAQAQRYVSTYIELGPESMNPMLAAAHEQRRAVAFEKFAAGRVQAVLGNTNLAVRSLETAYEIFAQVQHDYRAALAAQALYELTNNETWLDVARAHAAKFPKSAICKRLNESPAQPKDTALESLTPMQRQFALAYAQGADMEELSKRFSRSKFTLQAQIETIYKALDVDSRASLANELSRRGLL